MSLNLLNVCLVLSITTLLTGCFATMFSGTTQKIRMKVTSSDGQLIDGAKCIISDQSREEGYLLINNPGVVTVPRNSGVLNVNCKKTGYEQLDIIVGDSFNKLTLLNALFIPLLTPLAGVGYAVAASGYDIFTGAYKQYPSHYLITMEEAD